MCSILFLKQEIGNLGPRSKPKDRKAVKSVPAAWGSESCCATAIYIQFSVDPDLFDVTQDLPFLRKRGDDVFLRCQNAILWETLFLREASEKQNTRISNIMNHDTACGGLDFRCRVDDSSEINGIRRRQRKKRSKGRQQDIDFDTKG